MHSDQSGTAHRFFEHNTSHLTGKKDRIQIHTSTAFWVGDWPARSFYGAWRDFLHGGGGNFGMCWVFGHIFSPL